MFCPKCGTQNPDDGRFCRSCGADLGNVSAALTGKLPKQHALTDRKGRAISWESAVTKIFTGIAFLVVTGFLANSPIGTGWWFWMLIPGFSALGAGIAQFVQLKKAEQQVMFAPPAENALPKSAPNAALPPTSTDYVAPPKGSIYDTGEFAERPGSVTEGTTRHLEINSDGETMTLPKK